MKGGPRIAMEDIARMAGVSRATVSRSLANSPLISVETKTRVVELAKSQGYVVNDLGRRFRNGRANTISVVIPLAHDPKQPLSDPFFSTMLGLLADELSGQGYDLLLTRASALQADWIHSVAPPMRADGVIVIGQSQEEARLEEAAEAGVPLVVWGSASADDARHYTCVGSDNFEGGRLATRHLIGSGRRRILFMGDQKLPEVSERFKGYGAELVSAGLAIDGALYLPCAFDGMDAGRSIRKALASNVKFDAIFAASDVLAMTAIAALTESGLNTPGDVAVVGFDDVAMAAHFSPALTTIRQDFAAASRLMVRRMIEQIEGAPPTRDQLPVELTLRQSA